MTLLPVGCRQHGRRKTCRTRRLTAGLVRRPTDLPCGIAAPPTAWATRGLLPIWDIRKGQSTPRAPVGRRRPLSVCCGSHHPPALSCLLHSRTGPAVTVPPHCCLPESWPCCTRHPIPILLTRSACPFSPTFCCTSDRTSRFCGTWARLPSPSERDPPSGDRPLLAVSLMCLKGLKQPLARGRCSTKRRTNIQTHAWGRGLSLKGVLGLTGERGRHVPVPSSLGRCRNSTDGDRRVTTRTIPRYLEGFSAFTKETVWPEGRKEEPGGPHPGLPGSEPCGRAGARGGAPRALRHKGLLKGIH
ncbi:uncharacterized protein LOC123393751 [Mustela putorius furo]|uniref:Uncharacterized protein LOC123393751 n=1 Tax=Mustela putorius furo TaxID=9669 RepID=A0A8U0SK02_MUSPF|nr:uncharacterized protein LOC123393751 [Mustela putorius furo]